MQGGNKIPDYISVEMHNVSGQENMKRLFKGKIILKVQDKNEYNPTLLCH